MQTPVYAGYEAIEDDVHAVRKRGSSRLWYRDRVESASSAAPQRLAHSFVSESTSARIGAAPARPAAVSSEGGIR